MRARIELMVALIAVTALTAFLLITTRSHAGAPAVSLRMNPTTFSTTPGGAQGLFEAAQKIGIDAQRFRQRPRELARFASRRRQVLAILDPSAEISPPDIEMLATFATSADLMLVGAGSESLMRCFGYARDEKVFDSVRVTGMASAPFVHSWLVPTGKNESSDSSRAADVGNVRCTVPKYTAATRLLESPLGPVALMLQADNGHRVFLVADDAVITNASLRRTDAGPFILSQLAGEYDHILFDEYHHGFGTHGSLTESTFAWSVASPWGWAAWQVTIVGLLALLAGAIRFGPLMPSPHARRRSNIEHVRALATALSAAHGHDEAIAAMIRGLRRRLSPPALRKQGDWRSWLAERYAAATTDAQRNALATLISLSEPGQPPTSVLRAANAVEDLWQNIQG